MSPPSGIPLRATSAQVWTAKRDFLCCAAVAYYEAVEASKALKGTPRVHTSEEQRASDAAVSLVETAWKEFELSTREYISAEKRLIK